MSKKETRGKKRVYFCDDFLFSNENEESFYVAGFIAADGCIQKKEVRLRLSQKDESHLILIKSILKSNNPIKNYNNKYSGVSQLYITSPQMVQDLEKFNIVPRKSLVYTFPQWLIDHPLKNHFMRGYSDGDGSFYINKQYNEKISFNLRGTISFLKNYREILEKECNFYHRENDIPISSGCGSLGYTGNRNIIKIIDFLYKDATIYLERKYNVAMRSHEFLGNLYVQNM